MARLPKLFFHVSSTNLAPSYPVNYRMRATTHHWRGVLLDEAWAGAEIKYSNIYQTREVITSVTEQFLDYQILNEPSKDIELEFHEQDDSRIALTVEDEKYFDVVKLATSMGWAWSEVFQLDLTTGEFEKRNHSVFEMTLSTWEWGGHKLGVSVSFSHFHKEGESKAEMLSRILDTANKVREDFPNSIPSRTLKGTYETDEFATRVVFEGKYM